MVPEIRLKAAVVEVSEFSAAVLAADRNIDYSRENRLRALMAGSQGPRANIHCRAAGSHDRSANGRRY
jgi:hypothetical protein